MVYKTSNTGRVAMMQRLSCKSLSFAWRKNATRLKPSRGPTCKFTHCSWMQNLHTTFRFLFELSDGFTSENFSPQASVFLYDC
jgi:hypothetical protein